MIIDIFMIVGGVCSWKDDWIRGKTHYNFAMSQVQCVPCCSSALEDTSLRRIISQRITVITAIREIFFREPFLPASMSNLIGSPEVCQTHFLHREGGVGERDYGSCCNIMEQTFM